MKLLRRFRFFHLSVMAILLILAFPATSFSTVWRITCEGFVDSGRNIKLSATFITKDLPITGGFVSFSRDDIATYEIKDTLSNNCTEINSELLDPDPPVHLFKISGLIGSSGVLIEPDYLIDAQCTYPPWYPEETESGFIRPL